MFVGGENPTAPEIKNTPDDSLPMVTHAIKSGIMNYAISVQIC